MIQTFIKFFRFAGEQRGSWYKGIAFAVLHSLLESLQIIAILIMLKGVFEGSLTMNTVWLSLVIMIFVICGSAFLAAFSQQNEIKGSYYMCGNKRIQIGERMKFMPMGYFDEKGLGKITAAVTTTMEEIEKMGPPVMVKTIHGFIRTIIITAFLMVLNVKVGGVVVVGIIIFLLVNTRLHVRSEIISPKRQKAQTALVGAVLEYIQGMSVVKTFKLDKNANLSIKKTIREVENYNYRMELEFITLMAIQQIILRIFSVLVILMSVVLYLNGEIPIFITLALVICSFFIYSDLETAGSMSSFIRLVNASMDIVDDIYQTPVMDTDGIDIVPKDFGIEVRNICFSYDQKEILSNVSLDIPAGSTTAIVGPSGGGKSTFCSLLARFWDVDSGSVMLGGTDIRKYNLDCLMSYISFVFQNVYLFQDTIENNIRFGRPEASREEVIAAAKKACCHEFIETLPDGYDTVLGEGGATISGGEKQRISIARAILKDAPIIILDEATASVDPENEKLLQSAIREMTKNKTLIMIAHRLKTVRDADQIVVIDQGTIVQRGRHEDLITQGGLYAEFIKVRQRAVGWKLKEEEVLL
ncbi:MAG: ABC transporter ATP-binding protein [Lachnospiraceae bacterium]